MCSGVSLTGIAGAEDLQVMADLPEAILLGNRIGPTLDSRSRDLDRSTADAADEVVVVVPGGAAAVRGLTVAGADRVKIAGIGHELQGSVNRRQTNAIAVMSQIVMNLLCRPKVEPIGQDFFHRCALSGPPLRTRRLSGCGLRRRAVRHLGVPRRGRLAGPLSAHRSDQHAPHADDLDG
jgi:hypothetical protein